MIIRYETEEVWGAFADVRRALFSGVTP